MNRKKLLLDEINSLLTCKEEERSFLFNGLEYRLNEMDLKTFSPLPGAKGIKPTEKKGDSEVYRIKGALIRF
jgi:hypothetical protein